MKEEAGDKKVLATTDATANAVQVIKAAILQSQQTFFEVWGMLDNYNSYYNMKKIILISVLLVLSLSGYAVHIETTVNLNVYYPEYSKVDLVWDEGDGSLDHFYYAIGIGV